ncbi:MAG: dephospho-CoA kinase [Methylococcales bacterium]|nr:dephospho-CoA kinase [Methylococcales bacterium]
MLKIGLTGGIACGKSTVSDLFASLGVPVVDADVLARQVVAPGQPVLQTMARQLGEDVINDRGELDRARLKRLIFADVEKKRCLEALLHPLIYQAIDRQLALLTASYAMVAVPLLVETQAMEKFHRILVVSCSLAEQRRRLRERDGLDGAMMDAVIASQVSDAQRRAVADDVIDNEQSLDLLADEVKKLHNFYSTLAAREFL